MVPGLGRVPVGAAMQPFLLSKHERGDGSGNTLTMVRRAVTATVSALTGTMARGRFLAGRLGGDTVVTSPTMAWNGSLYHCHAADAFLAWRVAVWGEMP